ncbi:putative DNA repair and recombination protein,mitochondrial precursor [Trypanosoma rangeli]|uniref:ATP-dependent DNA helicase n=1 Tax=Trypanosoma rangeli TaxID=5698 RepID=A0A422NYP6_TRYRA|nr:putative DNA repair and recombination protein,mitochondrial precursor [Trypanosoma rangeli]RNF10623.1 putative DNA repair and recombination protein,mitochondrial precursor [Trypanosoma rangeli]|eukprot:RNF10623.1 putative DNA repair and recombination protein,mitochondrial precursor [Trypanosoma rangeli]
MLRRFVSPWLCAGVATRVVLTGYKGYACLRHPSTTSPSCDIHPMCTARRFMCEKQPKSSSLKAKNAAKRRVKLPIAVESVADVQLKPGNKHKLQLPQPTLQTVALASSQLKQKRLAGKQEEVGLLEASSRAPKQEIEMLPPVSNTMQQFAESTLVYNALTGRMTSELSPSMLCLKSIGFGVNEKRQVYLEKPEVLRQLAQKMRNGTATLPAHWPVSIIRALGVILRNRAIMDPAEAIQQMIQVKINNLAHNRYADIINAVGSGDIDDVLDRPTDDLQAVELNEEQKHVIELALKGHLMYIGGSAGTGKTVLIRALNHRLQAERLRVAMTATTGVAGCHIGGSTFHHTLGVSSQGEFLRKRHLLDYDVIIVDEVSMLSKRVFEEFDRTLREEAGTPDIPFGGVQIILCGDFLQLGVINEASIITSKLFHDSFVKLRLETQVRQAPDSMFAKALQELRLGVVSDGLLRSVQQLPAGTMVESAVNLLPTNKEVHVANERELQRLPGDAIMLVPETGITTLKCDATATVLLRTKPDFSEEEFSKHVRSLLQATLDMPKSSLLCLYRVYEDGHAMRVCLPQGESAAWRDAMRERFLEVAGLINDLELGATVTEILPNGDGMHTPEIEEYLQKLMQKHPIAQPVTFKKGCRVLLRANLSSRLVNGSIGTVVDFVECALENIPSFLRCDRVDNCVERYRIFCMTECGMQVPLLPVVRFHSGSTIVVPPWEFNVGGGPITNYYSLSSVALPLCLAYAFTVHKVQGLTLVGRVHLELSRMWPCEHLLYVAMSRVRNPDQLSMSSFQPSMVIANKGCVEFDRKLPVVQELPPTANFHVSSWKRCNDTIYNLRRRGASLSHLLAGATLNGGNGTDGEGAKLVTPVKGTLEHSVLVARRMRKLIKCTERAAKLQANRQKSQPVTAAGNTDDIDDTTAVEHVL